MSQLVGHAARHIIRRAIEQGGLAGDSLDQRAQAWEEHGYKIPTWAIAVLFGTLATFLFLCASVQYTVGHVVTVLAMIEEPSSTLVGQSKTEFSNEEPDATIEKAPLLDMEQNVHSALNKPITSTIRRTIAHITAQGGWTMRWRGLGAGMLYFGIRLWFAALAIAVLPTLPPITPILAAGVSAVVVSPLRCLWTHSTITKPVANLTVRDYISNHGKQIQWRSLLLPSLWAAVVTEATGQLVYYVSAAVMEAVDGTNDWRALAGAGAILVFSVLAILFGIVPALVVLTRVEASLLPEDFSTLVPFDRTFGGAIQPAVVGMSALARMKAAWKSFTWGQYRRVIGLSLKTLAITMALLLVAAHVITLEMVLIMGDAFKTLLIAGSAQLQQMALQL